MSFLLDALLDAPLVSAPAPSQSNLSGFSRSAALLSCSELLELVRSVVSNSITRFLHSDSLDNLKTLSHPPMGWSSAIKETQGNPVANVVLLVQITSSPISSVLDLNSDFCLT